MNNKNDVTILVNSCDKYEDAWEPFFVLLEKYWIDHPRKILLNSETIEYDGSLKYVKTVLPSRAIPAAKDVIFCSAIPAFVN